MTDTATTFEAFITAERERLSNERGALWDQIKGLEERVAAIDTEMKAITAYEAVKTGKPLPASVALASARKPRDPDAPKRSRAPREESQALRQQILDIVRQREGGADAADLYAFLEKDHYYHFCVNQCNAAISGVRRHDIKIVSGRRRSDRGDSRDVIHAAVAGDLLVHENTPGISVDLQATELRTRANVGRKVRDLID